MGSDVVNSCGKTTLGQFAALIKVLNLFICNEGGPLHIAGALGVKTVSIFGPQNEIVYGPVGDADKHAAIFKKMSCRPCYRNFKPSDCNSMDCLLKITEDNVLKEIKRLL